MKDLVHQVMSFQLRDDFNNDGDFKQKNAIWTIYIPFVKNSMKTERCWP